MAAIIGILSVTGFISTFIILCAIQFAKSPTPEEQYLEDMEQLRFLREQNDKRK